ncbi:unnamed protein product [Parajaminaea phylloscopi]
MPKEQTPLSHASKAKEEPSGQQEHDIESPTLQGADVQRSSVQSPPGLSANHLISASSIVLGLLLLRSGFLNLLLVIATSAVLLLNRHVRTFLDLPDRLSGGEHSQPGSQSRTQGQFGILDPARYFSAFSLRVPSTGDQSPRDDATDSARHAKSRHGHGLRQLDPLPDTLKQSIDALAPLVVRDFIEGWYTHHSFGYPTFPRTVRSTVDFMSSSIWTSALESHLQSVDVATELLLTGSSVFLTCLRRRRHAKAAAESGDRMAAKALMRGGTGHWNSDEERIASLRSAMRAFFERHLPPNERDSDLVFNLVSEILTKQLWNLILTVGEPDFLNRNLVGWKESQAAAAQTSAKTSLPEGISTPPPSRPTSRFSDRDRRPTLPPIAPTMPAMAQNDLEAERSPALSRPTSAVSERDHSVPPLPPRSSISSPTANSLLVPDRSMISTPPSRSDSPMMPSFAATQASARQQQPRGQARMQSPSKAPIPSPAATGSQVPRLQSPPPYALGARHAATGSPAAHRPRAAPPVRTSSELSDGLSAVVGGLGNAIKGISRGADAIAEGIGGALISKAPDEFDERAGRDGSTQHAAGAARSSHAVHRSPEIASLHLSDAEVRRKPSVTGQTAKADFQASDAAWPSNLPADLGSLAEGSGLPSSLKSSLRKAETQEPQRAPSPSMPNAPPRMMSSQPYEVSPRQSRDILRPGSFSRPRSVNEGAVSARIASPPKPHRAMSSLPPPPPLDSVLSRSDSEGLYDSLEAFLEHPPATISNAVLAGEGEELLRLHVGLATIERLVPPSMGEEAEMFREDASSILSKARDGLSRALQGSTNGRDETAAKAIVAALNAAIAQLGFGPEGFDAKSGSIRDALTPVRAELMARLSYLYSLFWSHHCAPKMHAAKDAHTPGRNSPMGSQLSYEPRRKDTTKTSSTLSHTGAGPGGYGPRPSESPAPLDLASSRRSLDQNHSTPLRAPRPRQPIVEQFIQGLDDDDYEEENGPHDGPSPSGVRVTVTDISENVDRPNAAVDPRTFEFMCAVEPAADRDQHDLPGAGGFVLIRRWAEVLALDKDLRRLSTTTAPTATAPPPRAPQLPTAKDRTSAQLSADLETYLTAVLSDAALANAAPVLRFADRTRAAAAVAKAAFNPFTSSVELGRNIGKNFVEGVGAVGKAAASGLGQQQQNARSMGAGAGAMGGIASVREDGGSKTRTLLDEEPLLDTATDKASAAVGSTIGGGVDKAAAAAGDLASSAAVPTSAAASKSSQGLSSRALDSLLTSIFALADEALSLTGAWSMRRGVVRLLQSVVRQSYSGAIVSAFDGTASALSTDAIARWIDTARTTFWANGPDAKWSHVKGPPRTAKDRIESEEKARAIVVSYAPSQAAFVLGPGGRQACERGLEAVHGVICEDEGARDLVLTLVLRLVQML